MIFYKCQTEKTLFESRSLIYVTDFSCPAAAWGARAAARLQPGYKL
jgi:hypothetical protein